MTDIVDIANVTKTMPPPGIAIMKRDRETGEKVQAILGLPNDAWCDVSVQFATDDVATATVTLLLTDKQVRDLAAVLVGIPQGAPS